MSKNFNRLPKTSPIVMDLYPKVNFNDLESDRDEHEIVSGEVSPKYYEPDSPTNQFGVSYPRPHSN